MGLRAILTVGWPENRGTPVLSAIALTDGCEINIAQYRDRLLAAFAEARSPESAVITLTACDRLFRRRSRGFKKIQVFLAALNEIVQQHTDLPEIYCELDAFAYALLKGAKNIDFFLPERQDVSQEDSHLFRNRVLWLRGQIGKLERIERRGARSGLSDSDTAAYCALRRIVTRASARDERRALAALLVSGPSTVEQISKDLGLPYTLGPRILPTLEGIGVLQRRDQDYVIRTDALPGTVFLLRETLGIDLLEVLDE